MALNYIDNLDARLEMFSAGYPIAKPIAERIFDRVRPLPGNLVKPLEKFSRRIVSPRIEHERGLLCASQTALRLGASRKYSSSISKPMKLVHAAALAPQPRNFRSRETDRASSARRRQRRGA